MIVLLEPRRPVGFQSGGYRYQAAVMAPRLAAGDGALRAVDPGQLHAELAAVRQRWPLATVVVDGWFAATRPLPAGVIALLHMAPAEPWCDAACPVLATAAGTLHAAAVRAHAVAGEVVEPGLEDCFRPGAGGSRRPGPLRLLCVGTLGPGKGQAALWRAVCAAPVACELTLLGAGTESFAPVETAPLGSTWRGLGVLTPDAVATLQRDSDLCVSWSRSESFGMAVAEAVACGTPVLAFAVGEIPRFVQHGGNGWLLPATATDAAMAAQLHAVLQQPERLGRARAAALRPALAPWAAVATRFAAACTRLDARTGRGAG
jgi:glycosyltransferase involved in cell wall biosynthesis